MEQDLSYESSEEEPVEQHETEEEEALASAEEVPTSPGPNPQSPGQVTPSQETEEEEHDEDEEPEQADNYLSVKSELSKKWLNTQLTHHVSGSATNAFWELSMKYVPVLQSLKDGENVKKKTPSFTQERRKLYRDRCPDVKMKFGFKVKSTGVIKTVECESTPTNNYQRNPDYVKVFEEAHVKVITRQTYTVYNVLAVN